MLPFEVFYQKYSHANILVFAAVERRFRIAIDTDIDSAINLHLNDDTIIKFKQCSRGLYCYDSANIENNTNNNQVKNYTFLNPVERKNSYFYRREIKL